MVKCLCHFSRDRVNAAHIDSMMVHQEMECAVALLAGDLHCFVWCWKMARAHSLTI